jgi:hypothetical protein
MGGAFHPSALKASTPPFLCGVGSDPSIYISRHHACLQCPKDAHRENEATFRCLIHHDPDSTPRGLFPSHPDCDHFPS